MYIEVAYTACNLDASSLAVKRMSRTIPEFRNYRFSLVHLHLFMYIIAYFQVYLIPAVVVILTVSLGRAQSHRDFVLVSRLRLATLLPFHTLTNGSRAARVCWRYIQAQGVAYCGTLNSLFV